MPPTFAAARNTACGRWAANHRSTAAWSRRSTSLRAVVSNSTSSTASRRTSAEPTMPRWPATNTVLPFSSNAVLAIRSLPLGYLQIVYDHFLDQLGKRRLRFPAEFCARLAGIADQLIDLGRPEITRIDANHGLAGFPVDAGFIDTLAAPFDRAPDFRKRQFDEFAHRTGLPGRQYEIIWRVRLQDRVHALDIVPRMAPVALGPEVAEVNRIFETDLDAGDAAGDLARDKRLAADRALVIEQDAVGSIHAIGFAVVHGDPVAIELGDAIGRARIERRRFLLRHFLDQTIELGSRGLVEPRLLFHTEDANGFEEPQHADGVRIGGIFRAFEADGDMALGGEIVDLGRPDLLYQPDQVGRVGHVAVMHQERHVTCVGILIKMIDAGGIERRRPPLDTMHGIAEAEKVFGEVGAVLTGDAGNQRHAPLVVLSRQIPSCHILSKRRNTAPLLTGRSVASGPSQV